MKNCNTGLDNDKKLLNDTNQDDSSGNGNSSRSRFKDRLLNIRNERRGSRKYKNKDDDRLTIKDFGMNIFKLILVIPSVVYNHIIDSSKDIKNGHNNSKELNNKDCSKKEKDDINDIHIFEQQYDGLDMSKDVLSTNIDVIRRLKVNKIKDIDVSLLKKNKDFVLDNYKFNNDVYKDVFIKEIDIDIKKEELKKEILDLIKKKLVRNINELEILQSDLYVLKKLNNGEIYLDECQENINEIKSLLSKVSSLKEKYDYLRDTVDFEYMLEYDDDLLIDKILELKDICSRNDIRNVIDDYKILDEYKYLYLKIDKLQDDMFKYEEYKNNKVEELKQRDIDFDKMKCDLYDVDGEKERYDIFVRQQELLLKDLNDKVSKIDSYEKVTYRLKGFNRLLGNSFKYLGLLLVNPLKGVVPSIAVQTITTKNMIKNLYNNLEWEEERKTVYEAIDYSSSINSMINNLDNMSLMINSTLEDIIVMKAKYVKEFSQYENSFFEYKDAIRKIEEIENFLLGNKIKVEMIQRKMMEKEKENESKLKMVKKLNTNVE